jgi:hypothetical protein
MQLNDSFQVCLLALASRYPEHVVDINEAILGPQSRGAEGWTSLDVIEMLQETTPEVLQATARLVVDTQKSEIYLIEHSEEIPAVLVHCRGRLPRNRRSSGAGQPVQV